LSPFIVAFTSSPSEEVRHEAEKAIEYLVDKHPSFLTAQLVSSVQLCYKICNGQVWSVSIEGENDETVLIGPLAKFYEKSGEAKRKGVEFMIAVTRIICDCKDLNVVAWLMEAVSLLRLRLPKEVLLLIKKLSEETALIADVILEEGAVDALDTKKLIKFILMSAFHAHLKRQFANLTEDSVKAFAKYKVRAFQVPRQWLLAGQEAAYNQCLRIIQDETVRVSLDEDVDVDVFGEEGSEELSMKSPTNPAVPAVDGTRSKAKKSRKLKVSKPKAAKQRSVPVPVTSQDSPASQRWSSRSSSKVRVNYCESDDGEVDN
jgi:hypothetical protein